MNSSKKYFTNVSKTAKIIDLLLIDSRHSCYRVPSAVAFRLCARDVPVMERRGEESSNLGLNGDKFTLEVLEFRFLLKIGVGVDSTDMAIIITLFY